MEGLFWDAIELSQMTFCLAPEVLNAIDVVAFRGSKRLGVINADMVISLHVKTVVTPKRIGVNDAVRRDAFPDDGHQRLCFGILNDLRIDLPSALQNAKNRNFPCGSATTLSFASAAEVTLIDLDFTVERPLPLLMGGNGLPTSKEEENGGIAVHVHDISGSSRSRSRNKEFHQLIRLALAEFASLESHG